MRHIKELRPAILTILMTSLFTSAAVFADSTISAVVASHIFDKVNKNNNWKTAFVTGKSAQVVFMSVSPKTNAKNEIGMETHKFDQVIFVTEGNAKVILDGKESIVKAGDMIFIPEGVAHNVINLNHDKPLKILSVYSSTDVPANASYKKNTDVPQD